MADNLDVIVSRKTVHSSNRIHPCDANDSPEHSELGNSKTLPPNAVNVFCEEPAQKLPNHRELLNNNLNSKTSPEHEKYRLPSGSSHDSGFSFEEPPNRHISLSLHEPDDISVRFSKQELPRAGSKQDYVSRLHFIRYSSGFVCDENNTSGRQSLSVNDSEDNSIVFHSSYNSDAFRTPGIMCKILIN